MLFLLLLEGGGVNLSFGGFKSISTKEKVILYQGSTTLGLYNLISSWGPNYLVESSKGLCLIHARTDKTCARVILILAVLLLVSGDITWRLLSSHLKLAVVIPGALSAPLRSLPTRIGDCVGNDLSICTTTRLNVQKHFANDFLSRRHTNAASAVLK